MKFSRKTLAFSVDGPRVSRGRRPFAHGPPGWRGRNLSGTLALIAGERVECFAQGTESLGVEAPNVEAVPVERAANLLAAGCALRPVPPTIG